MDKTEDKTEKPYCGMIGQDLFFIGKAKSGEMSFALKNAQSISASAFIVSLTTAQIKAVSLHLRRHEWAEARQIVEQHRSFRPLLQSGIRYLEK